MPEHDPIAGPLETSVHQRLDALTRSVVVSDGDHAATLARREIPLLVQALRSVLATHEPDAHGRCPVCGERGSRSLFRRRPRRLPCRAYLAVQLRLGTVEQTLPEPRSTRRHRRATHLRSVG